MTAETLRRAADAMLVEESPVLLAVADWLADTAEEVSEIHEALGFLGEPRVPKHGRFAKALAVATAYLGDDA